MGIRTSRTSGILRISRTRYQDNGNIEIHPWAQADRTCRPGADHYHIYKGVPRTGQTPPLSVPVRNRGYLHLMQLHTISMYNSPLHMASVCKNHSLAAIVHLIYILFEVVWLQLLPFLLNILSYFLIRLWKLLAHIIL